MLLLLFSFLFFCFWVVEDPEIATGSKENIVLRCVAELNNLSYCAICESSILEGLYFSLRSVGRVC